jgi:hypothetical protein
MPTPPRFNIDPLAFHADPYPTLAQMRAEAPIAYVPQLGAVLITRHTDISVQEKRIEVFSSAQPNGLMTKLMGENMMRKDGPAHAAERRATFPAFSPRTVRNHWLAEFRTACTDLLNALAPKGHCDLVADFAMPLSGEALRSITGLKNMTWAEIDRSSQGMMDGIANYSGDSAIEAHCNACTALIDARIDAAMADLTAVSDKSLLAVQLAAGLPLDSVKANIKLAISGGQNEPRDAIAGTVWALLTHPDQLALIHAGQATWRDAFEEFARWISPIGISPRRIARAETVSGVDLEPDTRAFFVFSSGNRDADAFADPDRFDILRSTAGSLSFGAGPHFCAGAAASRALITEVALPMLFDRLPDLRLAGNVPFVGWAFRGPTRAPVAWGI